MKEKNTQIESDIVDEDVIKPSEKMSFPMLLMMSLNRINNMTSRDNFDPVVYERLIGNHGRLLQPYFDSEYNEKLAALKKEFDGQVEPLGKKRDEALNKARGKLPELDAIRAWFQRNYLPFLEQFCDEKLGLLQELTDRKQLLLQKEGVSDF